MKPSVLVLALALAAAVAAAAPAAAHKPRVYVPEPRQVGTEVEYRVVLVASNLGSVPRRFHVARVVPQPLGDPTREPVYGAYVPPGDTHLFELTGLDDWPGLLEVTGAPQVVIRARLEIYEGGQRLRTVAMPAVAAHLPEDDAGTPVLEHGVAHDLHLQGLSRTADGSVSTDLTIVNFEGHAEGECAMSIVDAQGEGVLGLPFLHVPPSAAVVMYDVLMDAFSESGDILEAWGAFACEKDTFTAWAVVYRDGGRDVEFILPSADLK